MTNNIWQKTTIGELFDIEAGKALTPKAKQGLSPYPFLRTANVFWGKIDLTTVDSMDFTNEEIEKKALKKGDLLVCEGGDIGRSAIWNGEIATCAYQNHLHRLRPKTTDTVPMFYMYYLQAGFTQLNIYEGAGNKTTIPNMSRNRLSALEVPRPSKPEQEKIAAILWKIQKAIEAEDTLIRKTKELKRAVMNQLFTKGLHGEEQKETEIGHVPKSWKIDTIGNLCEIKTSSMLYSDLENIDDDKESSTLVTVFGIKVSDMNKLGNEVEIKQANLIKKIPIETAKKKLIPSDALVFPKRGAAIATNKKRITTTWTVLDPNLIAIITSSPNIIPLYMYYWFLGFDLRQITESGPTPQLNKKHLVPITIPVPSILEQKEIVSILKTIDYKIEISEKKGIILRELFKTTLQKLMTNEISVNNLDINVSEVIQI